jgi:hypothetical protein
MRFNGWMDGFCYDSREEERRDTIPIQIPREHEHEFTPGLLAAPEDQIASIGILPRAENQESDLIFAFSMVCGVEEKDCGSTIRRKQVGRWYV